MKKRKLLYLCCLLSLKMLAQQSTGFPIVKSEKSYVFPDSISFEKRNKKNEVQYLIQIKNYDEYGRIIEEKFPVHSYSRTFEYVGGTMLVSPPSGEAGTKSLEKKIMINGNWLLVEQFNSTNSGVFDDPRLKRESYLKRVYSEQGDLLTDFMMKIQNGKKDTTRFQKHFYGFGDGKNDKRYFVLDKNDRLIRSRYERIDSLNGIEKVMHINHGHTGINDTTRITTIEQKGEAFPGFSTNNFTTRIENGDTTSVTSQTTLTIDSLNTTEIYMVHNFQQNLITKSVWHTLKNKYKKMMIYEYRRGVWKLTRIIDTKMNEYGKEYLIIDYAPITKKTTIRLNEFEYY